MGQARQGFSIKVKLTLLMTGMVVLMFGTTGFLLINGIRNQSAVNSNRYLEAISAQYANRAKNFLEEPLFSARSLALTLSDFESIPVEARRRVYTGMALRLLEKNEKWVGVWIQWEPGLLDARDSLFRNDVRGGAGTESGAFAPYWTRGSQGLILEASSDEDYLEDYYVRPKTVMHEIVTEPYFDDPQGTDILMVSAVAPIISSEGEFLGAVGIDISLDSLQEELGSLQLYEHEQAEERGFGRMISPLGIVCTHPSLGRIGKPAPEWTGEEAEQIKQSLASGNQFTQESYSIATGATTMKSFVPFKVGQDELSWMFGTVVPLQTYYRESTLFISNNIIILILGLLGMIVAILVAVGRMLKPIGLARDALRDIAEGEGDLTRNVEITDRDEVGELAAYFNEFSSSLADIVNQTRDQVRSLTTVGAELEDNMERVGSALEEIGATLNDMSRRSSHQTSSIMEVSSTVEEIVGNLNSLNRQIENQNETLASSASAVEEMVANIQSITRNVDISMGSFTRLRTVSDEGFERLEEVNDVIRKISDQSDGLQEANSIINNIASQTNLLAMNAAIEAAHAGEAGKGFAVVADEIRKLAEESAGRSRDISNLLKSLHSLSEMAVESAGAAGTAFESIRSSVEEVTNRQQEIRTAVEQQSSGNKVVLDGVHHLKQISTEVGSGSKEIALGSQNILKLVLGVVETTRALQTAIDEITRANSEINSSTLATRELSRRNRGIIDTLGGLVARFKT